MPTSSSSYHPLIAFMTDFGSGDGDVGVLKGVALGIVPQAQLVDITHEVAPQRVASAAWILSTVYRYFPAGTVFVCVIDPGVGSTRRAIALHAGDWYFVGPDNGLFSYIYAEQPVHGVMNLSNPAYHLAQVSSTFHGRDIFTPVGAHLARGVPLEDIGEHLEPDSLIRLPLGIERHENRIESSVVHIDHFGNIITGIPLTLVPELFSQPVQLHIPARGIMLTECRRFFSATDEANEARPFIYGDSSGYIGVAIRNGNAARTLGVAYGDTIILVIAEREGQFR